MLRRMAICNKKSIDAITYITRSCSGHLLEVGPSVNQNVLYSNVDVRGRGGVGMGCAGARLSKNQMISSGLARRELPKEVAQTLWLLRHQRSKNAHGSFTSHHVLSVGNLQWCQLHVCSRLHTLEIVWITPDGAFPPSGAQFISN